MRHISHADCSNCVDEGDARRWHQRCPFKMAGIRHVPLAARMQGYLGHVSMGSGAMSLVGPSRRKSMSAYVSAIGGEADVLVTFANDASDPTRTWSVHRRACEVALDFGYPSYVK